MAMRRLGDNFVDFHVKFQLKRNDSKQSISSVNLRAMSAVTSKQASKQARKQAIVDN